MVTYLPLVFQVNFVAHHEHRELISVFNTQDLAMELKHLIQSPPVRDGEDQQEALAGSHVLLPHGAELLLASRVQN